MKIIDSNFKFKQRLFERNKTSYIILHHRAGNGDALSIHNQHLNQGWSGIGYNFYVRKDGSIFKGRDENAVGAHTPDYNSVSIGICFEGNFEHEKMSDLQLESGKQLIAYLLTRYPKAQIKKHRDFSSTACPGKNFPYDEMIKKDISDFEGIISHLNKRGIITNISLWKSKVKTNQNAYWLCYKAANMTENFSNKNILSSVNDIVWELNHRGIMTDKALWLNLLDTDENLYHLAKKICNMTKNI